MVAARDRAPMFFRLVFRAMAVRNSRLAIAMAAITVGAAVVSALASLYLDISIKMSEELRAFGANFYVGPAAGRDDRGIDDATAAGIVGAIPPDRLTGASPFLYGVVRLDLGQAVLAGVDFQGLRKVSPYWQVEGSWIGVDFDERNAMVGRRLAQAMELKVGGLVNIINRDRTAQARVTVKGIVETGGAEDDQIFVNRPLAQRLLGMPGQVDFVMARVVPQGLDVDALAGAINARFAGVEAKPIRKVSQSDGRILDRIEGLMALVVAVILVITSLCVNATLTAMVAERTPEIGLHKALGAGDGAIVAQFLAETALVCLAGSVVGMALGFALAQLLGQAVFGAWVSFRPVVLPLTLGVSLAVALVAAVVPVCGAMGVVPARVLKGD